MSLAQRIKQRFGRRPLTSSQDVSSELARARRQNEKLAAHRPLRGGDHSVDPRSGIPPTP